MVYLCHLTNPSSQPKPLQTTRPVCAQPSAPAAKEVQAISNSNVPSALPLTEQTVGYLEFFRRWETPLDDEAARAYSRLVSTAPDFETFLTLAPVGSEQRRLFERHIGSFEEAAQLIKQGRMRQDLFFDAWYLMPQSWHRSAPYVHGMRAEANNPHLYEAYEWLAERAEAFWTDREKNPPQWHPIEDREPSPGDGAVFEAFNQTGRDQVALAFVDDLAKRAPNFETFAQIAKPGSEEFLKFDRVFCAYDQGGTLVKNGIVHPALFFASWRSPGEIWAFSAPWLEGIREMRHNAHLYENLDWLVEYEKEWRTGSHA